MRADGGMASAQSGLPESQMTRSLERTVRRRCAPCAGGVPAKLVAAELTPLGAALVCALAASPSAYPAVPEPASVLTAPVAMTIARMRLLP